MGADTRLMKRMNKKLVRSVLRQCGKATKPELAEQTGLSVVTINSLMKEFIKSGEAAADGMAPSGGGRPSVQYRYLADYKYAVILYGHQKEDRNLIHARVVDLAGKCVWKRDEYYDEIQVRSFDKILDEIMGEYGEAGIVAFGMPGEAVDGVVTIMDYERLIGPEFLTHYKERYELPVLFENDINAMTYGACERNHTSTEESVVGIYFPRIYLPGAGLVLDGHIYYGTHHFSGELGSIPMPVSWLDLDYGKEEQVVEAVKTLLIILCCTIAPARFVLYGDFFTKQMEEKLRACASQLFQGKYDVDITVSDRLEEDYELGMKKLALEALLEYMD